MFEVLPGHIERLHDEHLRELVARLCESEVRRGGQSPLHVTAGGNQTSKDGGIDVRVSLEKPLLPPSSLPTASVGLQVKATTMPPSAIYDEMRPKGILRESIQNLADAGGSYIIVSSRDSVADSFLADRLDAMREAVRDYPNGSLLHLDFYDQTRIATWVREHAGLVLWVREKIGASIQGWQPFRSWTNTQDKDDAPYLLDGKLRIQGPASLSSSSVQDGLNQMRTVLALPRGVVRLVGLSGTGKTRMLQALFDERLGDHALAPNLAVYTNISDDPSPQPVAMCTDLIGQNIGAVMIVDNCPPDLHRSLTKACQRHESALSLITVEYDVREDQPEGTDVFELQPASNELISQLLRRRFPHLSQVNTNTIAGLSDGNARVAIALAGTVGPGESLATLRDGDLFERMFFQRHNEDRSLLRTAQACSLVYSFQGEDSSTSDEAEMWRLARVFGLDVQTFFENFRELERRDLVQKRGPWRALLPHAIANRLASLALENLPATAVRHFWSLLTPRLLRSFSRRVGFLHASPLAIDVVRDWLSEGGLLGRVENLSELGIAMLNNVAPVCQKEVLDAIGRASERQRSAGNALRGGEIRVLLRSLTFEAQLFSQSISLLIDLIEFDEPSHYANAPRNDIGSLFHLALSGTHATIEQRVAVVEILLRSRAQSRREIGYVCLEGLLQTPPFSSFQRFEFGARSRDFGYLPKTKDDVRHWFSTVLDLCDRQDQLEPSGSDEKLRKLVSDNVWGIWRETSGFEPIEALCGSFAKRRYWPDGWIALRRIRAFREETLPTDQEERLARTERLLEPKSLQERIRVFVLRRAGSAWDDIEHKDWEEQLRRLHETCVQLGKEVANDDLTLEALLPELVSPGNGSSLFSFARGMVESGIDIPSLWEKIAAVFGAAQSLKRSSELLAAILGHYAEADGDGAEVLLASAYRDERLNVEYPYLQSKVVLSTDGQVRLQQCLADPVIPVDGFRSFAWSEAQCSDDQLAVLLPALGTRDGAFKIALDCLWIRLESDKRDGSPSSEHLLRAGRDLLANHNFRGDNDFEDHHYGVVCQKCLSGPGNEKRVRSILARVHAASFQELQHHHAVAVMKAMIEVQPLVTLDAVFERRSNGKRSGLDHLLDRHDHSVLEKIPANVLLDWCDQNPTERYPWIAANIEFFSEDSATGDRKWKPLAWSLLERASDSVAVMRHFVAEVYPTSWSGPRSAAFAANLKLLDSFPSGLSRELDVFVEEQKPTLVKYLIDMRAHEEAEERQENERFE